MVRHLVMGYGEVGRALTAVLNAPAASHEADAIDPYVDDVPPLSIGAYHVLHVCIPFKSYEPFARSIMNQLWALKPEPTMVAVHSTVPLGTSAKLARALPDHSVYFTPVRGVHPSMVEGLKTFAKYVAGPQPRALASMFNECGIPTHCVGDYETAEAMKLWDTTQYGWQIVLAKEIARWCKAHGLKFEEVYRHANRTYNGGYLALGRPEVVRPFLKDMPGPIGGHCVMPNAALLGPNLITDVIESWNTLEKEALAVCGGPASSES